MTIVHDVLIIPGHKRRILSVAIPINIFKFSISNRIYVGVDEATTACVLRYTEHWRSALFIVLDYATFFGNNETMR